MIFSCYIIVYHFFFLLFISLFCGKLEIVRVRKLPWISAIVWYFGETLIGFVGKGIGSIYILVIELYVCFRDTTTTYSVRLFSIDSWFKEKHYKEI